MHSIEKAKKSKLFNKIVLVTNKDIKIPNVNVIKGGKERSDSSFKALKYLIVIGAVLINGQSHYWCTLSAANVHR